MEWFLTVVRDHYADFSGRARRQEYWMYTLVAALIGIGLYVGAAVLSSVSEILGGVFFLAYGLFALGLLVPGLAVVVRRLHDTGRSGWWYLIALVPLIGGFVLLYFLVIEGDAGPNEYGPDPKDPYSDAEEIGDLYDALDR